MNYDFFIEAMEKYGFVIVPRDEAKTLGLPEGTGMFIELYNMMMDEVKRNPIKESDYRDASKMRKYEKDISFLNRYFVFKKIRTINAEKLTNSILGGLPAEYEFEEAQTKIAKKAIAEQETKEQQVKTKAKPKALNRKLLLMEATEAKDDLEVAAPVPVPVKKSRTKKALVLEEDVATNKTTRKKAVEFDIEK